MAEKIQPADACSRVSDTSAAALNSSVLSASITIDYVGCFGATTVIIVPASLRVHAAGTVTHVLLQKKKTKTDTYTSLSASLASQF